MKREAFDHPKIKLLARDLRLPLFAARGLVDSIWMITATNFPQGQIRWTPEELAMSLDYQEDADEMVAALVKRKLLDPMEDGSWYVHDWHEHADDAVNMKLARNGQKFANGALPNLARLSKEQRDKALQKYMDVEPVVRTDDNVVRTKTHKGALPEPEPEPEPEPVTRTPKAPKGVTVVFPEFLDNPSFRTAWESWSQHRKEKKKPLTPTSVNQQLQWLASQPSPSACINQSILNGWTGLFEIKGDSPNASHPPSSSPPKLSAEEKARLTA